MESASIELNPKQAGTQESTPIDRALEKKLVRKLDFRVIPILWFLFLVSFFDRSNIGNAKIAGMTQALKLKGNDYNIAVTIFTVSYVVFGVPANLLVKKIGPKILAVYMFCWGLFVLGQGLTKTTSGLIACRFFMGMFEAGFVPGCAYLIGCYYKRNEFLRRYAVFFSANMAAGAFNGLFSTLLQKLDGKGGLEAWQWIFVMEAIITLVVSIFGFFIIVPFPENASFLTADEKALLMARIEEDGGSVRDDDITLQRVLPMLADWKIWLCVLGYMAAEETASSLVAFQPTILKDLGWTASSAQWHTIPVYATAFVFTLSSAWLSDYLNHRYLFTVFGSLLIIIGWAIQLAHTSPPGVLYTAMFFVSVGAFINMSTLVVWLCTNLGKGVKRTVGMGILTGFGNCGAFVSGNVFITNQSPKYPVGFGVGLAFGVMGLVANSLYFAFLFYENRRRNRAEKTVARTYTTEENKQMQNLGDGHPDFRYQL
ncbi:major facilitator superfamily domain-containing protein [Talaromyces proteolyticus]|uniref:Major facilitator superfamily domain-containing protein n=1 Tax=Talaromyces proteolyticus TaxID=1131652 RepID=A0AAD4KVN6_9EURO|nr:major facilitator superfamily domain-containing protein [Talaromyces proteolyticus]KAH8702073.1 major facilitator superfamily domain-containing protein [Talaromyces proteolyticus]